MGFTIDRRGLKSGGKPGEATRPGGGVPGGQKGAKGDRGLLLAAFMQASFALRAALIVAIAAGLIVAISTLTSSLENDSPSQASSAQPPAASSGDIRSADRPPEVRAPGTTGFDALGGRTGPRTKIENVPVKTGILSVGLKVEVLDGPLPTGESGRELEGGSTVTLPPPPQKAEAGTEASTPGR